MYCSQDIDTVLDCYKDVVDCWWTRNNLRSLSRFSTSLALMPIEVQLSWVSLSPTTARMITYCHVWRAWTGSSRVTLTRPDTSSTTSSIYQSTNPCRFTNLTASAMPSPSPWRPVAEMVNIHVLFVQTFGWNQSYDAAVCYCLFIFNCFKCFSPSSIMLHIVILLQCWNCLLT